MLKYKSLDMEEVIEQTFAKCPILLQDSKFAKDDMRLKQPMEVAI